MNISLIVLGIVWTFFLAWWSFISKRDKFPFFVYGIGIFILSIPASIIGLFLVL